MANSDWTATDVEVSPRVTEVLNEIKAFAREGHYEEAIETLCLFCEYQERSHERVLIAQERTVDTIDRIVGLLEKEGGRAQ